MKLYLSTQLKELGVLNPVGCLVSGVKVSQSGYDLTDTIEDLDRHLHANLDSTVSTPEAKGFVKLFERLGYPDQTPAGQRLIEGILNRGFKQINNLVDAYNIVSANHSYGIGMHDAEKMSGDLYVFRSTGTEAVVPMFKSTPIKIPKGDLLYGFREGSADWNVLACLGKHDVDSDNFKVTLRTNRVLVIALGNESTSGEYNRRICTEIFDTIRRVCLCASMEYLESVVIEDWPPA